MNGTFKKLSFPITLAFVSLFTIGCSVQEEAEKTVIVTEDVEKESSLADSSLKITRLEDIVGQEDNYDGFRQGFWGEKTYYSEDNNFFVYDVKTGTKELLIEDQEVFRVSASANYALSYKGNEPKDSEVAVHNLQNGKIDSLTLGSLNDASYDFANAEGNEVVSVNDSTKTVSLMNLETNKEKTWNMKGFDHVSAYYVKKVGNELFLIASSEKDGYGVYQLKDQGKVDHVTRILGVDLPPLEVAFLKNNTALFNGRIDGKHGIYLLDFATGHMEELVPRGISTEGKRFPFPAFSLSPDESKVMFNTFVQVGEDYKSNVYIGELVGGKLLDTVKILDDINLYSGSPLSGSWREDSKMAYIDTWVYDAMNSETITVFEVE